MSPLISVIIPVYNVAPYLKRAVQSVQSQTYANLEIILINDGSTDASQSIGEKLRQKDPRITLITKHNGGVSSARNRGIEAAKGDYIFFLDGDDEIAPETLREMLSLQQRYPRHLIVCGLREIHIGSGNVMESTKDLLLGHTGVYDPLTLLKGLLSDDTALAFNAGVVYNKLYHTDCLKKNFRFPENIRYAEDDYFSIGCLYAASNIYYCREPYYRYYIYHRKSRKSLVNSYMITRFENYKEVFAKLWETIFSALTPAEQSICKHNFVDRVILTCILLCRNDSPYSGLALEEKLTEIVNDPMVTEAMPHYRRKAPNSWTIPLLIRHKKVKELIYFAKKRARRRYQ